MLAFSGVSQAPEFPLANVYIRRKGRVPFWLPNFSTASMRELYAYNSVRKQCWFAIEIPLTIAPTIPTKP
jgi:hypothetical protein